MDQPTASKRQIHLSWVVIAGIVAIALLAKLVQWLIPSTPFSLLPLSDHLVQTASLEEAEQKLGHAFPTPTNTIGASIFVVGVYPNEGLGLPAGSVDVVYAKDGNRFVDLLIRPGFALDAEREKYRGSVVEDVQIGESKGYFVRIHRPFLECHKATKDRPIAVCQLTRVILFERDGILFSIAADGTHATDGELLTIARSIQR